MSSRTYIVLMGSILAAHQLPLVNARGSGPVSKGNDVDFRERVYNVVKLIPTGSVTNYGSISRAIGAPRGARLVGQLLKFAPSELDLPAHRVVNRKGVLTGAHHFGPPDEMRRRLEEEGITFVDEITVDMQKHYWDPSEDPRADEFYEFREI